jgi:hypothetical protein
VLELRGDVDLVETHYTGTMYVGTPTITVWYYSTKILEVDFKERCFTTFGTQDFSSSTDATVKTFFHGLIDAFKGFHGKTYGHWDAGPFWTTDPDGGLYDLFRSGVPWMRRVGSVWYCHWDKFDKEVAERYYGVCRYIREDQHWRWWTAGWENGVWTPRLKNAEAERLWKARLKRYQRCAKMRGVQEVPDGFVP